MAHLVFWTRTKYLKTKGKSCSEDQHNLFTVREPVISSCSCWWVQQHCTTLGNVKSAFEEWFGYVCQEGRMPVVTGTKNKPHRTTDLQTVTPSWTRALQHLHLIQDTVERFTDGGQIVFLWVSTRDFNRYRWVLLNFSLSVRLIASVQFLGWNMNYDEP